MLWAVLIVVCGIVGGMLKSSYDDEISKASAAASNLATAITQDIARNIEIYDLSLQAVIDRVADPETMRSSPKVRQAILFDHAAKAPFLGAIFVLDDKGDIALDSGSLPSRRVNFADREYFTAQADRPDAGLYISRPLHSRLDDSRLIGLSRRVNKADGSFGGIVLGTMRLEYIHKLLARMRIGARGSITLFRTDGTILMREPYVEAEIGKLIHPEPLFSRLATADEGEYIGFSVNDGVERLYHYHRVGTAPLVLNVGLSIRDVYADFWRKAAVVTGVLATCCIIVFVLARALKKELARRTAAEAALVILAREDSLTGLANRRRFDEVLETEWRVATRSRTPLSLLMIDVDRFKAFNDALGHLAGDRALVALASCLSALMHREGDVVARYGGEEFAVILPQTDADGAMDTAETLRTAIAKLDIRQPGGGTLTVSIGAATWMHGLDGVCDLIAAADGALYAAKAEGRNRSKMHCWPEELAAGSVL